MISDDLKTTILGIIGALAIFAKAKGWIDLDLFAAIGSITTLAFGYYTNRGVRAEGEDEQSLIGGRPNDR